MNELDAVRADLLARAEDPFAIEDVEQALIARLVEYSPDQARAWTWARLAQLAAAWGVVDPEPVALHAEGATSASALYLRRRWNARPLEEYARGDSVRWFDGRSWLAGLVETVRGEVPVKVHVGGMLMSVTEAVDLQLAHG